MARDVLDYQNPDYASGTSLSFTGTSAQSAAITVGGGALRLAADQHCWVSIGANPTAAKDGTSILVPQFVSVDLRYADGDKVAAIRDTTSGTLYITPL